jgi:hypothetical protein
VTGDFAANDLAERRVCHGSSPHAMPRWERALSPIAARARHL